MFGFNTTKELSKKAPLSKPLAFSGIIFSLHCSLLFEADASVKEVQERLGHTDVQTTLNIYTHLSKSAKNETINKFVAYLNS
ncbi:tyrosine-type recombinase/integrase [Lysinibacillus pakistanensis]|uniref:tyrosine-type recombinase/integrase n=1 Tax=Lysinibacillus pakistanensis TaxID=759811 RepID=UPI003D2CDD5D